MRTSARAPLALLGALTEGPATTSDLYGRVGYPRLMELGLIPYERFRAVLAELAVEGLVEPEETDDGTCWRVTERGADVARRRR